MTSKPSAKRSRSWLSGLLFLLIPVAGFFIVFKFLDDGPIKPAPSTQLFLQRDYREQIIDALKLYTQAFEGRFPDHLFFGDQLIAKVWRKLELRPGAGNSPRAGFGHLLELSGTDKTFGYYGKDARLGSGQRPIVHWSNEPNQNTVVFSDLSWRIVEDAALKSILDRFRVLAFETVVQVGGGSGVIVSSDGLLLTSNHSLPLSTEDHEVQFVDGRKAMATLIGRSIRLDVAVLRIPVQFANNHVRISKYKPQKDDAVWAIGYPGNAQSPKIRLARVDSFVLDELIINDKSKVRGGDSGGAIIDESGELVGIIWGFPGISLCNGSLASAIVERWPELFAEIQPLPGTLNQHD